MKSVCENSNHGSQPQFLLTKKFELSLIHYVDDDCMQTSLSGLHGHSFKVQVVVKGVRELGEATVIDRDLLDRVFYEQIFLPYNGKNVNTLQRHGTGESLAKTFYSRLKNSPIGSQLVAVQLVETRKNRFQVS